MSKRMKAKRFSETFYQHDLVLVPTRKSWERRSRCDGPAEYATCD